MTTRTVLLTGATGYLGSHLARRLAARPDHRVIVLKRSSSSTARIADCLSQLALYDSDRVEPATMFAEQAIDVVVNCAADYGRSGSTASQVAHANLLFPLRLLECASKGERTAFINVGTSLPSTVSDYALSKIQFTDWLRRFSSGMSCTNLVLEHYFGPGEEPSKFIAFLVDSFLRDVPELKLTAGEQRRDFIYIDDLLDAMLLVIDGTRDGTPGYRDLPVGSGQAYRMRKLVETVHRLVGNERTELKFGAVAYRPGEVMESVADLSRLQEMGWTPRHALDDGLRRTVEAARQARRAA